MILWKDIKNWETLYEVSDNGDVRNKKTGKLIVGDINNCGYYRVRLCDKNHTPQKQRFFRHRLVAETFIPNTGNLKQVNHISGDKSDNSINNLEWVTQKENELHSRKVIGVKEYKPFVVIWDNNKEERFDVKSDLAVLVGLTVTSIKNWLHKKSKGYVNFGIKNIYYI